MNLVVSKHADADLLQIFSYLSSHHPKLAEEISTAIHLRFESLLRFPYLGRERTKFAPGLRSIAVRLYVIFYLVEDDQIIIVRVMDGRRDLDAEFQR